MLNQANNSGRGWKIVNYFMFYAVLNNTGHGLWRLLLKNITVLEAFDMKQHSMSIWNILLSIFLFKLLFWRIFRNMPARGLLNDLMIQSSTFLVCSTVKKGVRVKICFLFSCQHLLTEYNNDMVVLLFHFYDLFLIPKLGQMDPESILNCLFNVSFP